MTPQEKAKELVEKLKREQAKLLGSLIISHIAKQSALIAVDEILNVLEPHDWGLEMDTAFNREYYWQQVRQEIEKL